MLGLYAILGLLLCIRLVVKHGAAPKWPSISYAIGFVFMAAIGLGGHEVNWVGRVAGVGAAGGLTYAYLRGLEALADWRFWPLLVLGFCVVLAGIDISAMAAMGWLTSR